MPRRSKAETADALGPAVSIPAFKSVEDARIAVKTAFDAGTVTQSEHDRAMSHLLAGGSTCVVFAAMCFGCGYPFKPRDGREALVYRLHDLISLLDEQEATRLAEAARSSRRRRT